MQLSLSSGILLIGALLVQGFWALQPLLSGVFCIAPWDSFLGYVHHGIACLPSQASDWAGALWDSLSGLWLATHCYVSIQA